MIDESVIPEKSIFKSSEVCDIVGVKPYILRFWESEFVEICSIVSSSGKKLYEKKDIILISMIKELLFDKKLTLEKAKQEISKIDLKKLLLKKSENLEETEIEVQPTPRENVKEPVIKIEPVNWWVSSLTVSPNFVEPLWANVVTSVTDDDTTYSSAISLPPFITTSPDWLIIKNGGLFSNKTASFIPAAESAGEK